MLGRIDGPDLENAMNLKAALIAGVASAAVGLAVGGCQTYDFEPVEPLALAQTTERKVVLSRKKKPNIMLLVDKSGSMKSQVTSTTTRLSEMKSAMNDFLVDYGNTARFGLAVFPEATKESLRSAVSRGPGGPGRDRQ